MLGMTTNIGIGNREIISQENRPYSCWQHILSTLKFRWVQTARQTYSWVKVTERRTEISALNNSSHKYINHQLKKRVICSSWLNYKHVLILLWKKWTVRSNNTIKYAEQKSEEVQCFTIIEVALCLSISCYPIALWSRKLVSTFVHKNSSFYML